MSCAASDLLCMARDTEHWNDYAWAAWSALRPSGLWLTLIVLVSLLVWGGRPSKRGLSEPWFWRVFAWGGWLLLLYYLVLLPRIGRAIESLERVQVQQEHQAERLWLEQAKLERDRRLNHPIP